MTCFKAEKFSKWHCVLFSPVGTSNIPLTATFYSIKYIIYGLLFHGNKNLSLWNICAVNKTWPNILYGCLVIHGKHLNYSLENSQSRRKHRRIFSKFNFSFKGGYGMEMLFSVIFNENCEGNCIYFYWANTQPKIMPSVFFVLSPAKLSTLDERKGRFA